MTPDSLPHGFPICHCGEFRLVSALGGAVGEFSGIVLPQLPAGFSWSIQQSFNEFNLQLIAGDYNSDGIIDLADYARWRDTLGQGLPAGTGADGNRDGFVNYDDLQVWQSYFARVAFDNGAGAGGAYGLQSGHELTAVPEPACSLLLFSAGLVAQAAFSCSRC